MDHTTHDFEQLLAHRTLVRGLARRLVLDEASADDVVQQTWLAAIRRGPRDPADPHGSRAWLASVVRKVAAKLALGDARRVARERAAASPEREPPIGDAMHDEAMRRALVDAVFRLAEPWRTTIVLRYLEGKSRRAIAQAMSVPQETVHTRLRRGLELLRADLDRTHGDRRNWCIALVPLAARAQLAASWLGAAGSVAALALAAALVAGAVFAGRDASNPRDSSALVPPLAPERAGHDAVAAIDAASAPPIREIARDESTAPAAALAASGPAGDGAAATTGDVEIHVTFAASVPAAGVGIVACCLGDRDPWFAPRRVLTDANGFARLEKVAPGEVDVFVDRGFLALCAVKRGRTARVDVSLDGGEDVRGRVVDRGGAPVGNAEVFLTLVGSSGDGRMHTESATVARTAADGSFLVRQVAAERGIGARAAGFAPSATTLLHRANGPRPELTLVLEGAGGAIDGTIVDDTGMPIAGARVALDPDAHRAASELVLGDRTEPVETTTYTDSAGAFAFAGVAVGAHRVIVRAPGREAWSRAVDVAAGASTPLRATLGAGGVLVGRVVDASGVPVAGARIVAGRRAGEDSSFQWAADDGTFRLENLAVGDVLVAVKGGARGFGDRSVTTVGGVEVHAEIRLDPPRPLRLRLVDGDGQPCDDASVHVIARAANGSVLVDQPGSTDAAGRFVVAACPDVDVVVECGWRPLAAPDVRRTDVRAGGDEIEIRMPRDPRGPRGDGVIHVEADRSDEKRGRGD